ncbi:hypothetical protein EI555_011395, partial [Monodon monoceros]
SGTDRGIDGGGGTGPDSRSRIISGSGHTHPSSLECKAGGHLKGQAVLQTGRQSGQKGSRSFTLSMNPRLRSRLYHGCYGAIMTMETSGATCDITRVIAGNGFEGLQVLQILIKEARHCMDPALTAAIISRESHGGTIRQDGWDHKGLKFGLMQAVGILTDRIKANQKKFPTWSVAQYLKGVTASEKTEAKDLGRMLANKASIQEAGKWFCVDSTTIAAMTSWESHAGRVLRDAWGDTGNGFGFGLMQ